MNDDVILQVKDLHKYYPMREGFLLRNRRFVHAVDGVDLEIHRGEMLGLVGESGCGKSTLGRLVLGLEQPTSGKIFFEGKMIHEYNKSQLRRLRREMQIIFQDPYSSLNPRKTVGNIINEPFVVHHLGDHDERLRWVVKLLEVVGLRSEHYSRYPHEFSAGQRQRISIARALALNPKLIVADEPVASLDVSIQAQVINLLKDLQDQYHLTYLFISHDLGVIKHITNRVGVMYLGKIVELGESKALFRDPQHPYTEALLSAIPVLDQTKKKKRILLEGDVPSPINPPPGCRFHTRCLYTMEACKNVEPVLKEVGPSHWVACYLRRS
jgi:oligopeptide transport system ATP-binding protein